MSMNISHSDVSVNNNAKPPDSTDDENITDTSFDTSYALRFISSSLVYHTKHYDSSPRCNGQSSKKITQYVLCKPRCLSNDDLIIKNISLALCGQVPVAVFNLSMKMMSFCHGPIPVQSKELFVIFAHLRS